MLITFNGTQYDLRILRQVLFYKTNGGKLPFNTSIYEAFLDEKEEDVNLFLNKCWETTEKTINNYYKDSKRYEDTLPITVEKHICHLDILPLQPNTAKNLYFNKIRRFAIFL